MGHSTWHLAEVPARRNAEIAALRRGHDLGMNLIDTAEMYADGNAEVLAGEAIAGRRDEVFLVSKVLPYHATRAALEIHLDHDDLVALDAEFPRRCTPSRWRCSSHGTPGPAAPGSNPLWPRAARGGITGGRPDL